MNQSISTSVDDGIYPSRDGKPMAETDAHVTLMARLLEQLRYLYRRRGATDVYVAANMFLYYQEGDPKKRRSPDVMVSKGVKNAHLMRRSFKTWVEGVLPRCILELTSKKTAKEDQKIKKPLYESLRIPEYFLFDPYHDYLPRQLMGYRLVGDDYEELVPDADGALISEELGLRLVPEGYFLGLYDLETGERIPCLDDMQDSLEALTEESTRDRKTRRQAEKRAEEEKKRAEEEKKRAEEEKKRAEEMAKALEEERRRVAEMQAELARLKGST